MKLWEAGKIDVLGYFGVSVGRGRGRSGLAQGKWWSALHSPSLEAVSQPGSCQSQTVALAQPQSGQMTRIPSGGRAQGIQGVFKAEHEVSMCLEPSSSWNFYQLITGGTHELVTRCVFFYIFAVFLSFL